MITYRSLYPRISPEQLYYNWTKADSTEAPLRVAVGKRGIGKSFGPIKKSVLAFLEKGHKFTYVVENKVQIATLTQDKGSKFWQGLKEYAIDNPKTHKGILYKALIEGDSSVDEDEFNLDNTADIKGGTIRINGHVCGYIVAWDDFANLKRNNFSRDFKYIIIDEFMPEIVDINSYKIKRKIVSLVQSIARTRDVIIYMMSNSLRRTDIILEKLLSADIKIGEARILKDNYGVLAYVEYIDSSQYKKLNKIQDSSIASRLAVLFDEDNLDKNIFRDDLKENEIISDIPNNNLLCCLHGKFEAVRIGLSKSKDEIYITEDYGSNTRKRYCINRKYITPKVIYAPEFKEYLERCYSKGICKFSSAKIKMMFLVNLELNLEAI